MSLRTWPMARSSISSSASMSSAAFSGTVSRAGPGMHHHSGADSDAGRTGHTGEARVLLPCGRLDQRLDVARGFRVRDDRRELRRQRDEESFVVLVESPPLALADNKDAQHAAAVDDGYAEKRVERFFAYLFQVQKPRMARRVVEIDGLGALRDQSDQAFVGADRDGGPRHPGSIPGWRRTETCRWPGPGCRSNTARSPWRPVRG